MELSSAIFFVLSINKPNFKDPVHDIYLHEIDINETTDSYRSALYLNILLSFHVNIY